MFFSSYLEFLYVFSFIIIFNALRWSLPKYIVLRKILLLAGSFVIISTIIDFNTLFILVFLMLGFYSIGKVLLIEKIKSSSRKKILVATLGFLITLFCIRNYTLIGDFLSRYGLEKTVQSISFVGRVGLSYILFRLLHFLVDAYRGKIYSQLNPVTFLNYIFFFPTFLSGPIDRYNNFDYWERSHRPSVTLNLIFQGSARVFIGAVKKIMIVPVILPYVNDLSSFDMISGAWEMQMLLTVLAYTFYIYFDFSGYSDIAIGSAYLIGIRSPENFNNPYISKDIAEFWKRWHISFSTILGEYVFKPIVVGLSKRFSNAPRLSISVIGYIITFVICGLWHGSTRNFAYWGLWHGIGLAIFKIWDTYKPVRILKIGIIKFFRPVLSIGLTFIFVSLGWYFFMTSTQEIHNVLKNEISFLNREYSSGEEIELTMRQEKWEEYGYGIDIRYLVPKNTDVDIEYKKIDDGSWISVVKKRSSETSYFQLHGSFEYKETSKNLEPGLYVIRIRNNQNGSWYGDIFQINNYIDE